MAERKRRCSLRKALRKIDMNLTVWQWVWAGVIVFFTVVILLVTAWFYSSADIRRVQAYARAAGVSTT